MAGEWIKMRTNLWDDPRVGRICDMTGLLEAQVIGGLYWLWKSADEHTETGHMPGLSTRRIDQKTGCPGLGKALVVIGWITETDDGVTLENFEEHNGSSAKKRCQTAKRVANFKAGNAEVTQPALPEQQQSVSTPLPREEKRRINTDTRVTPLLSGQPSAVADPQPENDDEETPPGVPKCPHKRLLALWAKHLPHLMQPRVWEGGRVTAMRQRWIEASRPSSFSPEGYDTEDKGVAWWDSFFHYVATETKLSKGFTTGERTWVPDLPWVLTARNFANIIDGKYAK